MRFIRNHKILSAIGGLVLVILIVAVAAAGGSKSTAHTVSQSTGNGCPSGMAPDTNGVCQPNGVTPTDLATTAAPTQSTPSMTVSQQQAVQAAQGYLQMGSGFSKTGLIKQLTSSYGNGFSNADATFAVNYLHPDWDAQAVDAAKGYMQMGGFSRESLINQLTSSYGNGFTYDQAVYAANQVGL